MRPDSLLASLLSAVTSLPLFATKFWPLIVAFAGAIIALNQGQYAQAGAIIAAALGLTQVIHLSAQARYHAAEAAGAADRSHSAVVGLQYRLSQYPGYKPQG